jgi:hypothetical protein
VKPSTQTQNGRDVSLALAVANTNYRFCEVLQRRLRSKMCRSDGAASHEELGRGGDKNSRTTP